MKKSRVRRKPNSSVRKIKDPSLKEVFSTLVQMQAELYYAQEEQLDRIEWIVLPWWKKLEAYLRYKFKKEKNADKKEHKEVVEEPIVETGSYSVPENND